MNTDEVYDSLIPVNAFVIVVLKKDTCVNRCWVGQVRIVKMQGITIELIDGILKEPIGPLFYIPWLNIDCAYMFRPGDDFDFFIDTAVEWYEYFKGDFEVTY